MTKHNKLKISRSRGHRVIIITPFQISAVQNNRSKRMNEVWNDLYHMGLMS